MEPLIDVTTYSQYKAGTERLANWLVETAACIRVSPDYSPSTGRSVKTSTKKLEKQTKHRLPLDDFTRLAQAIAASTQPVVRLPKTLALVIRETIRLRKFSHDVYSGRAGNGRANALSKSNGRHLHFVTVLQGVLAILDIPEEGCIETSSTSAISSTDIVKALALDEAARGPCQNTVSMKQNVYEPEHTNFDSIFALHTFWEDMNSIREFLSALWADYGSGNLDIMTVSVTTDTAFTIMKHSCTEIARLVPEAPTWSAMISILNEVFGDLLLHGESFLEWSCYRTAMILEDFCQLLEPNSFLAEKPGGLGEYDPTKIRSDLSAEDKYREDAIVLTSLLTDLVVVSRAELVVPAQDELTTGLRELISACSVDEMPTYVVFAAQVLLDIHHTLREHACRPFEELQRIGSRSASILDQHFQRFRDQSHPNWPDVNNDNLHSIKAQIEDWIQSDVIQTVISKATSTATARQPYQLLRYHPVLCGLKIFRLRLLLQDSGIRLCNATGSVVYPIHLYNALLHSADLTMRWQDMDYILSVHSSQRIFAGPTPTNPSQYLKHFLLAFGANAIGERADLTSRTRKPSTLKTTSPVKDIFRPRYVGDRSAKLTTQNLISMLSVALKSRRMSRPPIDLAEFSARMIEQRRYTVIELLRIIHEGLAAEELHLLFDYFLLDQRGTDFLKSVHKRLGPELMSNFHTTTVEETWRLPLNVGYIFKSTEESSRLAEELGIESHGDTMLDRARIILLNFLAGDDIGENEVGEPGSSSILAAMGLTSTVLKAYYEGTL